MRESIKMFIKLLSETIPMNGTIYEFGSLQVPGQEGFSDLRPFFPNNKYIGCDIRKGLGVDRIMDLHDIDLPSESTEVVLILDTLEHVEYPRKAIREVHRILKPEGILVISSVMNFPIHEYPQDFWRFTPQGFESILNDFNYKFVDSLGDDVFPHTVIGLASKSPFPDNFHNEFQNKIQIWKKHYKSEENLVKSIKYGNSLIMQGIRNPYKIMPFVKKTLFDRKKNLNEKN